MVDMIVDETQKHVDKLADLPAPPPGFTSQRADRNTWPPKFVRRFSPRFNGDKFNKAYLYRFLACLIYLAYQAPTKSICEAWSTDGLNYIPYLHDIMARDIF